MAVLLRTADLAFRAPASTARESGFALRPRHADQPVLLPATEIHPVAVAIPLAAAAWFFGVAWCAFGGGETSPVLAVVTFFCLIFFGLFVGGAALGRDMTPGRAHHRSFQAFLDGEVEIATGRITGGETLWQMAAMPVALAIGFTVIALIAVSV